MNVPVSTEANVACTRAGDTAFLTIGDGRHLNALGTRDWEELERQALMLGADPSVSSVVVRGSGGVFCSGSNLREWAESSPSAVRASFVQMERAFQAIEAISVPTVAFVERVAAGAGCQLALACDLQILSASSKIGMPIIRLGILTPPLFAFRLTARIGPARTKALLFSGTLVTAEEAAAMGLTTHVSREESAHCLLDGLLRTWSGMPRSALRAAKSSVRSVMEPPTDSSAREHALTYVSEDFPQRVRDFLAGSR